MNNNRVDHRKQDNRSVHNCHYCRSSTFAEAGYQIMQPVPLCFPLFVRTYEYLFPPGHSWSNENANHSKEKNQISLVEESFLLRCKQRQKTISNIQYPISFY